MRQSNQRTRERLPTNRERVPNVGLHIVLPVPFAVYDDGGEAPAAGPAGRTGRYQTGCGQADDGRKSTPGGLAAT